MQGTTTNLKLQARDHILLDKTPVGLDGKIDEETEIWYDYISVPQWEENIKARILRAIPDIFYDADFTLVHLDDVDDKTIELVRYGNNRNDRIAGVRGICNARWFKRVWTVMEYVRSRNVRVMNRHWGS